MATEFGAVLLFFFFFLDFVLLLLLLLLLFDVFAIADFFCFYILFEMCTKREDAKKVPDYFLQSTFRGDVKLNNNAIKMCGKCGSMTDARRVFDHMSGRNMDS